ncbi:MAG: protein kinase [Candidatus Krumholzibacteriota bacterium]|nr:protein kinase [Candidatus Krumholzibacteriota bacterium]
MIGKTVSHYRIIEKLGEGGMGVIYLAEDTKLGRKAALKFLPPALTGDREVKARFIQEARAASALDHPNICTVFEIDEAGDGQLFIAMAYYEGKTLKERIASRPLELDDALDKAIQIGEGLSRAHESGIVHRDIKPANIVVTDRGRVKILDFGLSKLAGRTKLTREGATVGTVEYMSPEQACGKEADHRADIWALGVVLYELLTGEAPFKGEYDQAVMYGILNEEPEPVTARRSGLPMEIDRILAKALAKAPGERYQDIDDFLVDLRSVRKGLPGGGRSGVKADKGRKRKYPYLIPIALVIVIAAALFLRHFLFVREAEPIGSVAVLPLENLSFDARQDYFTDGMTEALIANLAQIRALKVISRTSVMRFKGSSKSLPEIAKDLGVDAIIEGSVMRDNDRVRITAQLIEARSDRHIWADSYERDLKDIFELQSEVARAIVSEIKVKLTEGEQNRLADIRNVNPQAHEAYLRGRYHWNKRTKEGIEKGLAFFEKAIRIDEDYALAHAGLAEAYLVLGDWGYLPPRQAYTKAREIVRKALELDNGLAQAHSAYAVTLTKLEQDWEKAGEEFKTAIALNPNYETAHQWYSEYLFKLGFFEVGLGELDRAAELDPLSIIIQSLKGSSNYYMGRYEEAITQCMRSIELESEFSFPYYLLNQSYLVTGRLEEAMWALEKALAAEGATSETIAAAREVFAQKGFDGVGHWIIENEMGFSDQTYNRPYFLATVHAYLRETEKVLENLEQVLRSGSNYGDFIQYDPFFVYLHDDPRFRELLRRTGLPEGEALEKLRREHAR